MGEGRLVLAATVDLLLVPLASLGVVWGLFDYSPRELVGLPLLLGFLLPISFVNHVVGTRLLRGSFGKLLFGLRVVRVSDGGRPGFWRTVGRWLIGFVLIAIMILAEDVDGIGEVNGLRVIRRRDELLANR
ncbi:RDD family protein [Nocardia sp. NBC_01730]|uniref:RDD family protein n=1 Tax=Nocardia sp. NBC_01730 TaxID=2975998 RepID=UPI002E13DD53|nr:RDD family protein [Nocardia sp. NBC_01730]